MAAQITFRRVESKVDPNDTLLALRALGHASRLAAYRTLIQAGPDGLAVGALRAQVAIPPATLSAHLNVLRAAGLVIDTREGRVIRLHADYTRMNALIGYLTENCCAGTACGTVPVCVPAPARRTRPDKTRPEKTRSRPLKTKS